jgi:protein-S-isoprenylcysteine O-methyltransferase Ste14
VDAFRPSPVLFGQDLIDLGVRAGLGLIFSLYAGVSFSRALAECHSIDFTRTDAQLLSEILATLAIGLYWTMVAGLYALRLPAMRRASGIQPVASALLGSFLMCGLLLLDRRTDLPLSAQAAGLILVLAGNGFAIYTLSHLGRSFSILPESRNLVTSGPYRLVRHPLYLAEEVAMVGAVIQFFSAAAVMLLAAQIAFQLARTHYEESVLGEAFPEYQRYRARTWRLVPGLV